MYVNLNEELVFTMNASSSTGGVATIQMVGEISQEATFNPVTNEFRWTPTHFRPLTLRLCIEQCMVKPKQF